MLNVRELRTGNYLKGNKDKIPKFQQIHEHGIVEISEYSLYLLSEGVFQLEPIPLNHFWFKKFKFERFKKNDTELGYVYVKTYTDSNIVVKFSIYSDSSGSFFSIYDKFKTPTDKKYYVHQLQNIYLDVSGQELKRKF